MKQTKGTQRWPGFIDGCTLQWTKVEFMEDAYENGLIFELFQCIMAIYPLNKFTEFYLLHVGRDLGIIYLKKGYTWTASVMVYYTGGKESGCGAQGWFCDNNYYT